MIALIALIVAFVLFLLAGFGVSHARVQFVPLGLALVTLAWVAVRLGWP